LPISNCQFERRLQGFEIKMRSGMGEIRYNRIVGNNSVGRRIYTNLAKRAYKYMRIYLWSDSRIEHETYQAFTFRVLTGNLDDAI
jgi:hypothetical protein